MGRPEHSQEETSNHKLSPTPVYRKLSRAFSYTTRPFSKVFHITEKTAGRVIGCAIIALILLMISLFADVISISEWSSKKISQEAYYNKQIIDKRFIDHPLPTKFKPLTVGDIYKTIGNDIKNEVDLWIRHWNNSDSDRRDHARKGLTFVLEIEKKKNNESSSVIATLVGYQYLNEGNLQEAAKYFKYAYSANPDNVFASLLLYSTYKKERDLLTQKSPHILASYSNSQSPQNYEELEKTLARQEELRQLMEKLEEEIEKCLQNKFSSADFIPVAVDASGSLAALGDSANETGFGTSVLWGSGLPAQVQTSDSVPELPMALERSAPSPGATGARLTPPDNVPLAYGKLPLHFEANQGQSDPQVKFLARGSGYGLFLTATEAVVVLSPPQASASSGRARLRGRTAEPTELPTSPAPTPNTEPTVLRMQLVGANPAPEVVGQAELPGTSAYFIGNDPTWWRTGIPTYTRVYYRAVYPGIDLVYYGNQRQLEYDLVVAPGADPTHITLGFEGADTAEIDAQGDLVLHTQGGEVRLHQPRVYQAIEGTQHPIPARYVLLPRSPGVGWDERAHQVGFAVAAYDTSQPLIIDPVLSYATYLGGSRRDVGHHIAVDSAGNAYVTGRTASLNFPTTPGAVQPTLGGYFDAFVTKLNPAGSALLYSTYLGGRDDGGYGLAVYSAGNAYVTEVTFSTDFPTASPLQATFGGGEYDAFVTKLHAIGSALVYSTYLGGSGATDDGRVLTGGGNSDWGASVFAISNGTIISAQNEGPRWGNVIVIQHNLPDAISVRSLYAHLDERLRTSGDVARGEQIGTIGRGYFYRINERGIPIYDYDAHLHFEIRTAVSIGIVNPLGSRPVGITVTPAAIRLYVAKNGSASVVLARVSDEELQDYEADGLPLRGKFQVNNTITGNPFTLDPFTLSVQASQAAALGVPLNPGIYDPASFAWGVRFADPIAASAEPQGGTRTLSLTASATGLQDGEAIITLSWTAANGANAYSNITVRDLDISPLAMSKARELFVFSDLASRDLPPGFVPAIYSKMAERFMDELLKSPLTATVTGLVSSDIESVIINGVSAVVRGGRFLVKDVPVLLGNPESTPNRSSSRTIIVPLVAENAWTNFRKLLASGVGLCRSQPRQHNSIYELTKTAPQGRPPSAADSRLIRPYRK